MIFAVVCFFSSQKESKAQDPAFSQFYANPLYLNPAGLKFSFSQEIITKQIIIEEIILFIFFIFYLLDKIK